MRFELQSRDVIHSFWIAEYDAQMEALREKGQEGQIPVEGFSRLQDPNTVTATTEGEN
ncbi:Uncharacterised protein [Mycobacteroides abscessus]|nr:Uncharacterised protein [Mycobacteroides abscessus]